MYDHGCSDNVKGLASKARIIFFDMENTKEEFYSPSDLYNNYFDVFYNFGVRIVSNSWGSIEEYEYDSQCRHVDKFIWENNDMTIVFAAGNDGESGFNTVGTPGLAKNSICVGSSNGNHVVPGKFDYISYFSSRGNRYSKRIMPHVVSTGDMKSAKSLSEYDCKNKCNDHTDTVIMGGTSMATPSVSAAVAIITQYLNEGYYQNNSVDIRASLVKAMVIHGTVPTSGYCFKSKICNNYSSDHMYYEGWGRVQLDQVLHFDDSDFELFLYYGQIHKQKEKIIFKIPLISAKAFKATMVYTDPPVSEASSNLLGNDIDMTITIEGSSTVYYPNEMNGPDHYNNIEQTKIPAGTISNGTVLIVTISRYNLVKKLQPFSIVFTGDFKVDEIEVEDDTSKNYEDKPQSQRSSGVNIWIVILVLVVIVIIIILVVKINKKKKRESMMRAGRGNQVNQPTPAPPMGYGFPNGGIVGGVNPGMDGMPVQAIPVASVYRPQ